MKRLIILGAIALLTSLPSGPGFAQQDPPGQGFSDLLCIAEAAGFTAGNGQISLTIDSNSVVDGIGTAVVTITHGKSSSTHTIVYEDTDSSGTLTCGDVIISVT
jgi:hypothetical protein